MSESPTAVGLGGGGGQDVKAAKTKPRSGLKVLKRMISSYIVPKTEMKTLSFVSVLGALCFSGGTALWGAAVAVFLEARIQGIENLDSVGQFINDYVSPFLAFFGCFFYVVGAVAIYTRKSVIDEIKIESEPE